MESEPLQNIETLIVNFYEVDSGWMRFTLTLGEQDFKGKFSAVWDPILDFKHWLEAIAIGVHQCSFTANVEGCYIKFDFAQISWQSEVLTITDSDAHPEHTDEDTTITIKARIYRKQIVEAFYLGLLNFAGSDAFKSIEWENQLIEGTNEISE